MRTIVDMKFIDNGTAFDVAIRKETDIWTFDEVRKLAGLPEDARMRFFVYNNEPMYGDDVCFERVRYFNEQGKEVKPVHKKRKVVSEQYYTEYEDA